MIANVLDARHLFATKRGRFRPKRALALLKGVYTEDADSLFFVANVEGGRLWATNSRIHGIDAPETHIKAGLEKEVGLLVTQVARAWIAAIPVERLRVQTHGAGKFGRPLVDFFDEDNPVETLSSFLLDWQLVRSYAGKKKPPWKESELKRIKRNCVKALASIPEPADSFEWLFTVVVSLLNDHPEWKEQLKELLADDAI